MSPILGARGGLSAKAYGFTSAVAAGTSYESIATTTVGSGGVSSVTLSSIPSTYTHLQLRCIARSTYNLNASSSLIMRINGDTSNTNYAVHLLDGNGSSASAYGASSDSPQGAVSNATAGANIFGAAIFDILDYTNTNKYKTIRILSGNDNNGSGTLRFASGASYANTNAITSLVISTPSGDLAQYSSFALYGIKS
jgi:hypothetical protein